MPSFSPTIADRLNAHRCSGTFRAGKEQADTLPTESSSSPWDRYQGQPTWLTGTGVGAEYSRCFGSHVLRDLGPRASEEAPTVPVEVTHLLVKDVTTATALTGGGGDRAGDRAR